MYTEYHIRKVSVGTAKSHTFFRRLGNSVIVIDCGHCFIIGAARNA